MEQHIIGLNHLFLNLQTQMQGFMKQLEIQKEIMMNGFEISKQRETNVNVVLLDLEKRIEAGNEKNTVLEQRVSSVENQFVESVKDISVRLSQSKMDTVNEITRIKMDLSREIESKIESLQINQAAQHQNYVAEVNAIQKENESKVNAISLQIQNLQLSQTETQKQEVQQSQQLEYLITLETRIQQIDESIKIVSKQLSNTDTHTTRLDKRQRPFPIL
jgi:hypothetical protein